MWLYIFWFLHQTTTRCPLIPLGISLYIFWFLHQTTTALICLQASSQLYIFWFLHQTTTFKQVHPQTLQLYIFWFLHQTTTLILYLAIEQGCISFDSYIKPQRQDDICIKAACCISFDSYIKPQRSEHLFNIIRVVYLLIPTSNHNCGLRPPLWVSLYIFWFLHQTTTSFISLNFSACCISFDSYIKPQRAVDAMNGESVVYLLIPTSNHNLHALP